MIGYETTLPGDAFFFFATKHVDANFEPVRRDAVGILLADITNDPRFRRNGNVPKDKRAWEQALGTDGDAELRETFNAAWSEADAYAREMLRGAKDAPGSLLKQSLDDYGNGQRLVEYFGEVLRFAEDTGTWFAYDGQRWAKDPRGLLARYLAHATLRTFYDQAKEAPDGEKEIKKWAKASFKTAAIRNTLTEAAPYLRATSEEFDRDPWSLNVVNGTLDLKTGKLREHNRDDLITKLAPVIFDAEAKCPTWDKFLEETFGDNVAFVDRAVGYSITGVTVEKCMFIVYGKTNTGKTTFLETLAAVLGPEYAVRISAETMMAKTRDSAQQEDLADLCGSRLVITSETEDGQRFSESMVKRQTQGQGKIKACRKYEHTITFNETHKPWLDSNHLPMVHGADDSIWGRLVPIPAGHQVATKDKRLPEKLRGESSGILNRAVAGCREWQKLDDLGEPIGVTELRKQYRKQCDLLGSFLEETTVENMHADETTSKLYLAYTIWAKDAGEFVMTKRAFTLRLAERPEVMRDKVQNERCWRGRALSSAWAERVAAVVKARVEGKAR